MTVFRSPCPTPSTARRLLVFAAALTGAVLLGAGPAAAHVSVAASTAEPGGFSQLTFSVPNERADATTTEVEVAFSADQPLALASARPVPGWQVTVEKTALATPLQSDDGPVTEAVSRVVWSGGTIADGRFQNFEVSAGPLPAKATTMVFKVLQTYSDGAVVRWIDLPTPGGEEPEHPAPVLEVAKAGAAVGAAAKATTSTAVPAPRSADTTDRVTRVLAGVALLVALGAVALAFAGRRRTGPTAPAGPAPSEPPVPAQRKTGTRT